MSRGALGRTSDLVTRDLFDRKLRSLRRDRAARMGPELFLYDRAFDECLDRLRDFARPFETAMLLGCPSPKWADQLRQLVHKVDVFDPGELFATGAGGRAVQEDRHDFGVACYDLCVAVGTLDTVNDLPLALQLIRRSLRPDSPLIGAMAGGNTLAGLRASLIEAGRGDGRVVARTHPRIEGASLAILLAAAGYSMPVVDIDRVQLTYPTLKHLIRDLRAMGVTSVLAERPTGPSRREVIALETEFLKLGSNGRTEETVEILHFLGWNQ